MAIGRLAEFDARTGTEAEARAKRDAALDERLARNAEIGRAEGVSERLIEESNRDVRRAIALGNFLDSLFAPK